MRSIYKINEQVKRLDEMTDSDLWEYLEEMELGTDEDRLEVDRWGKLTSTTLQTAMVK